jgi:hypothetical protein
LETFHDLAETPRKARVQELVEQRVLVVEFDVVVQVRRFMYKLEEVDREVPAFRNDGKVGLVELGKKVAAEGEQVLWILVKEWCCVEIYFEVI